MTKLEHDEDDLKAAENFVHSDGCTVGCRECFLAGITHARSRPDPGGEFEDDFETLKPDFVYMFHENLRMKTELAELKERMESIAGDLNEICDGAEKTDMKNEVYHPASYYAGMERGVLAVLDRITSSRGNE